MQNKQNMDFRKYLTLLRTTKSPQSKLSDPTIIKPNQVISYRIQSPNLSTALCGYSSSIKKFMKSTEFQFEKASKRHNAHISFFRNQEFAWALSIKNILKLGEQSVYTALLYFDIFLRKCSKHQTIDFHLLMVTLLFISSKINEIHQIRIRTLLLAARKQFSKMDILNMESEILITLNFQLSIPTPYDFFCFFLCIFNIEISKDLIIYLMNLVSKEQNLIDYGGYFLALASFDLMCRRRFILVNLSSLILRQESSKYEQCYKKVQTLVNEFWYRSPLQKTTLEKNASTSILTTYNK